MGIEENTVIDRRHRPVLKKKDPTLPLTTICRLTKFKERQNILHNAKVLKDTGIFIYEEYCKATMSVRNFGTKF